MTSTFGEKIRALRKEKKLTLDQLAEKAQSSKSYIWELENKKIHQGLPPTKLPK